MSECPCRCLEIELIESDENIDIDLQYGTVVVGKDYPEYEGSYEAIPKVGEQIFETKKTSMEENFVVKEISCLMTPNSGGGLTVTIGEV